VVQAQLAANARVKPQTMSRTLARLEAHGYITRVNEASRRGQQVAISEPGRSALAQAYELERDLITESGIGLKELRGQLAAIIRQLGPTG
jgi:MarR family transcriptional regulator, organic hydroperoxide resistance regulator